MFNSSDDSFFPNRMVTILYSCYVQSEGDDLIEFVRELETAFNCPGRDILLFSTTKAPGRFSSFKELTRNIQQNISKTIHEFDFEKSDASRYALVHFLRGMDEEMKFDREIFLQLVTAVSQSKIIKEGCIEGERRKNWYGEPDFNFSYITSKEIIYITDTTFDDDNKTTEKKQRKAGWELFARLEFAQYDKLLLYYLKAKADEIYTCIQDDIRLKSKSIWKLRIYDTKYEKLCKEYLNSLEQTVDSFTRKIVYASYGSKDTRLRFVDEIRQEVELIESLYRERQSIYQRILGPFISILGLFPGLE